MRLLEILKLIVNNNNNSNNNNNNSNNNNYRVNYWKIIKSCRLLLKKTIKWWSSLRLKDLNNKIY